MNNIPELFGSMIFGDDVMRDRLPKETYKAVRRTMDEGRKLHPETAAIVANAMKDWAIEKGATHYTHWFQPMTGITAEKHDSFISPVENGKIIMEFSGKELIQGEPDASSFPSGGLRATFEARGYTSWDPTSYAFIKNNTLCIPTAFCSYGGEALDKKTPLLRSMEAINKQALRILRLFGDNATRVNTTVGPEQEYFLIDKELYKKRPDLILCGRTLFGAQPPKGQELEDHYFGAIKPRVLKYMKELDTELWKLGILAKTEHNEAAPAQHELAPIYCKTNSACDHNQLTMELMKSIAEKHGFVCLLHEKPFEGVNGSGKHNNWSLSTNTGVNLLDPGSSPYQNARFLLFLCAVIAAVDDYQELLRISVSTASNDYRLGGCEAPPPIISIFLGDELTDMLSAIQNDSSYDAKEATVMKVGVHALPNFPKDSTDRNRTSPFAFTGNKFEFRMLGSSASIADVNTVLNTVVAEKLKECADVLETSIDFDHALRIIIKSLLNKHNRIIFNGNNYSKEWEQEAIRRGLSVLKTAPDAIHHYADEKNIKLFTDHKIFTGAELTSRKEISYESYSKVINIEALTMLDMVRTLYLPSINSYISEIAKSANAKKSFNPAISCRYEETMLNKLSELEATAYERSEELDTALYRTKDITNAEKLAFCFKDNVIPKMNSLRSVIDTCEQFVAKKHWPVPSYADMLYYL